MSTILDALDDPDLFAGMFDAPSWKPWRAFLAALFGLSMSGGDAALYRHHTGRQGIPEAPFHSATLVCGRRGGKSRVLGLIATWLACVPDHSAYLVPGETPVVAIIAADRKQAAVILGYIKGFLAAVPFLAAMVVDELAETIRLTNGVEISVHTGSVAAPRGRTFLAVLCDETAFWATGDSANPDVEVVNAVRPGLSTIPYSLLLIASSPYARRGLLYTNFARYFGREDARTLVWKGSTQEMNATLIDDDLIAEMYREDPERADAEFGANFRSDVVDFVSREAVEAVIADGLFELPPGGGITYMAFVDPSGGSADSFTLAIGHVEPDGTAVLDCIRETKPPFSPDGVVEDYAALLKTYRVTRVVGDAYAGMWPRERFANHGVSYDVSRKSASDLYREFLPALNGKRVRLLDLPRLTGQLVTLERKTSRAGRDSISHQPGSHDDVANVAAGVLVNLLEDRRPALIKRDDLLVAEQPAEMALVQAFNAMVWVGVDGMAAYAVFAYSSICDTQLILVDFDSLPWTGSLLTDVAARLDSLCEDARDRNSRAREAGVSAFMHVPSQLYNAAYAALSDAFAPRLDRFDAQRRVIAPIAIDPLLLADPVSLALSATANVSAGRVKLGASALDRAAGKPLLGSLAIKPGERVDTDPLRVALLVGIAELDPAPSQVDGARIQFG
jgi:hypothetical protein